MRINDMPKLQSPFVRKFINNEYVVTNKITPGYEWVFKDDSVMAIEKLHGTNVSIIIVEGNVTEVYNRTERIPFINKGKRFITEGILESKERGFLEFLDDGQHFGELIGPKVNGNPYKLEQHLWVPFSGFCQKHLKYKLWGKYPKDFDTISDWFKELMPLYSLMKGDKEGFVEGIVFTHPDGRMAKLRCDMFDWFKGMRHKVLEVKNKNDNKIITLIGTKDEIPTKHKETTEGYMVYNKEDLIKRLENVIAPSLGYSIVVAYKK